MFSKNFSSQEVERHSLVINPSLLKAFEIEVTQLGLELTRNQGLEDYHQLRRFNWVSHTLNLLGYGLAWHSINPIAVLCIGFSNFIRWALVYHHISHGALDQLPGVPHRYTSKGFAKGWRRFTDWPDWLLPKHWEVEHNSLHHYHLGTNADPDVLERNARYIHSLRVPRFLKYLIAFAIACIWKPFYYAPNGLTEYLHQKGIIEKPLITLNTWNPFAPEGFHLWTKCLLPYIVYRFLFLPLLFLPLVWSAVKLVLINSILAEFVANLISFAAIGTNHAGEDIPLFTGKVRSKGEFYYRQIAGSVNFPARNSVSDFLYGGLNYQIEHHVWPRNTLYQYQQGRARLRAICEKYGVQYLEEPLRLRLKKTFKVMVGSSTQRNDSASVSHRGPT